MKDASSDMASVLSVDFANNFETLEKQEEKRLRSEVEANPLNFDKWLELIKHIEGYVSLMQKSPDLNKEIYRQFLKEFPQCFGYWRKLAEIFISESSPAAAESVFEEAFDSLPVNVEIWVRYCEWKFQSVSETEARSAFERAVKTCGRIYTSNLLWDRYVDMEKHYKRNENVSSLFLRILQVPTVKLYEYYTRFKSFIDAPARKLPELGLAELDPQTPDYPAEHELAKKKFHEKVISIYEKTVIDANKRKSFESGIKRSFFHAKPLDEEQLQNWRLYLEFEEQEGDQELILLLYERCVVPACLYAEFWCRYAAYLEKIQGPEAARALYRRANTKFLFRRPDLFLAQGYFEEVLGNLEEARRIYAHVYVTIRIFHIEPGLLSALLKHLNLERREGHLEVVESLYKEGLAVARDTGNTIALAHLCMHYARFQHQLLHDLPGAILTLETHLEAESKQLILTYIQYLNFQPNSEDRNVKIRAAYERALASPLLSKEQKMEIWVSYIHFMRSRWLNHDELMEVETRFQASFFMRQVMTTAFKEKLKIKRHMAVNVEEYPDFIKQRKI